MLDDEHNDGMHFLDYRYYHHYFSHFRSHAADTTLHITNSDIQGSANDMHVTVVISFVYSNVLSLTYHATEAHAVAAAAMAHHVER